MPLEIQWRSCRKNAHRWEICPDGSYKCLSCGTAGWSRHPPWINSGTDPKKRRITPYSCPKCRKGTLVKDGHCPRCMHTEDVTTPLAQKKHMSWKKLSPQEQRMLLLLYDKGPQPVSFGEGGSTYYLLSVKDFVYALDILDDQTVVWNITTLGREIVDSRP